MVFRSIARRILADKSLVDDVLQDAFARILQNGREFQTEVEAFHYLRRAVITATIDAYRKARRYHRRFRQYVGPPPSGTDCGSEKIDPLRSLLKSEMLCRREQLIREVREAVSVLPPEQREAIGIFFGERNGQRIRELCKEAGVPYSTLRSRMLSGIDRVRTQLRRRRALEPTEVQEFDP